MVENHNAFRKPVISACVVLRGETCVGAFALLVAGFMRLWEEIYAEAYLLNSPLSMTELTRDEYIAYHIKCGDVLATLATRISLCGQMLNNPNFDTTTMANELDDIQCCLLKLHRNFDLLAKA